MKNKLKYDRSKDSNKKEKKRGKAFGDALEIGMFFLMLPAILLIEVGTRKK